MPGVLLIGFRSASGGYTVVSAANPLPVTGGGGGGGGDVNLTGLNGVPPAVGAGNSSTGTQRVVLATDQPASTAVVTAAAYSGADASEAAMIRAIANAAIATAPTIVVQEAPSWVYIPAGSTDTAGGNANDLLDCLLVIPTTMSPGAVSIEDGAGTNYTLFAGGASSVSTLIPFPIDMRNIQATTAWEITTGANVAVIAFYRPRT